MGQLTALELLERIILARQDYIGTIEDMATFVEENRIEPPPPPLKFHQGERVFFRESASGAYRQGTYQYPGVLANTGKISVVEAGRIIYVLPHNIKKIYRRFEE